MDYICVLLSLFLILPTVDSNTCPSTNGVHVFGDRCDFMCHCKNNEQCDRTSGGCSSGCDKGWFGPGCQYRDLAADGRSSQSSAHLATDGNLETCYETKIKNKPAWKISFTSIETITELHLVTKSDTLEYFENFQVLVQNRSNEEKEKQECYKHAGIAPKSKQFIVLCNSRLVGDKVTIKLTNNHIQLVICDVKINGGRNLAFKRRASQVSVHRECSYDACKAENAVDGINNEQSWRKCSYSSDEENPWWNVDLGTEAIIHNIQIVAFRGIRDENQTYQIEIKSSTGVNNFHRAVDVAANVDININVIGRVVNLMKEVKGRLHICEVYVYGDCQENMCGYDCKKPCHCRDATIWDKLSGNCSNGCKDEWKGSQCNIQAEETFVCESGMYGRNCINNCSQNCKGDQRRLCSITDGTCFGGCNDGWKGNICDEACDHGFYGQNCLKKCSDHCKHGKYCNKINGKCTYGCMDGWKAPLCDQECPSRKFGAGCKEECASTCKHGLCDHVSGDCHDGCRPGYQGNKCDRACDPGFYGHNCLKKCSDHCKHRNEYCNNVDGNCTYGCMDGWKAPLCDQACPSRKFGAGCKESCASTCKNDACDHVNGICRDGCKRGYQGDKCESECGPGTFGENCQEKCSTTCKNGVCSHLDGGCSNGCKPGYHGNKCEQKCRDGTFGEECREDCSSNCNNNTCDHVTGNCTNGYKPGYKGNTCGENNILSGAKPDTGSNEARKPNIVLICVGILCVIVVVYATVITILFKRKTTHYVKVGTNVSCSGRSNDDAITSKTNKTETVTAEAAKEAATELARVNINVIHDESHQYTDLTPDTEDVEAAYETIQLE